MFKGYPWEVNPPEKIRKRACGHSEDYTKLVKSHIAIDSSQFSSLIGWNEMRKLTQIVGQWNSSSVSLRFLFLFISNVCRVSVSRLRCRLNRMWPFEEASLLNVRFGLKDFRSHPGIKSPRIEVVEILIRFARFCSSPKRHVSWIILRSTCASALGGRRSIVCNTKKKIFGALASRRYHSWFVVNWFFISLCILIVIYI